MTLRTGGTLSTFITSKIISGNEKMNLAVFGVQEIRNALDGKPNHIKSQLNGLVVECQSVVLKVLGSNPGYGAQEFSKLTFISKNSVACQSHAM